MLVKDGVLTNPLKVDKRFEVVLSKEGVLTNPLKVEIILEVVLVRSVLFIGIIVFSIAELKELIKHVFS